MSLAEFSVKNNVLINMIMIVVFILGIITMINIPKEEMPTVDFGAFYIFVNYRGVSPADVETLMIDKIEDELIDLDNVDEMISTASEGMATIYIKMEANADIDDAWDELNTEMDKVKDLPDAASDPVVLRLNMREINEMCTIALGGEFTPNSIRELAEDFKEEIMDLENISKVEVEGTRERQIWIESDLNRLNEYGLSLNDINNAVTMRNMNRPGGSINFGNSEYLIRTVGEFENLDNISEMVIKMDENGRAIRINDVALVSDTLEECTTISRLDGMQAVTMDVFMKAEGNIIKVMKDVRAKSAEFKERIPNLKLEVRNDSSINVNNSISTLSNNAMMGIILVFIVLWIFIGWRNALFAAWGIPFSFMLTFVLMRQFDVTMNNLSLFGLILVLGMIVDDAIIVLENIHRYREQGYNLKDAAILGTKEITWPVVAAVATTCAAFMPMLLMEGMMGKFMAVFPIVVSLALVASLLECLVILPSHVAEFGSKKVDGKKSHPINDWLKKHYRRMVKKALKRRGITMLIVLAALILALSAFPFKLIKFEFFPKNNVKTIIINAETPTGTNLEETEKVVSQIENYIMNMKEKDEVEAIVSTVGQYSQDHRVMKATSNAEIKIDVLDSDKLTVPLSEIKNSIRNYLDTLPGLYSYQFKEGGKGGPPTGKAIELLVKGENMDKLAYISTYLLNEIEKIPGTADLESTISEGKKEIQIVPNYEKLALHGLSVQSVASLISTASYGSNISKYRGSGMDEHDIVLRVKESQIDDLEDIENLKIRSPKGYLVAVKDMANLEIVTGYSEFKHHNGKRQISITGDVTTYIENGVTKTRTSDEITKILRGDILSRQSGVLKDFSKKFPGYTLEFGGSAKQQSKVTGSLITALLISLLLVYTILATQFHSYVQPLIVMIAIPFAVIGVIFGLVITNLPFSMNTMIAILALAGVVVNDSLVLVDFVNRERQKGVDRWNSLIDAGATRLRPILMTTVTTIAG
ncbi:MAG: efflux RND transporter permease subunit, partial [Candidatus Cloacimonetes bacterium]|nr:efflux RND transporter permease subunit [Candidatus Cloacimonadota bacterium]